MRSYDLRANLRSWRDSVVKFAWKRVSGLGAYGAWIGPDFNLYLEGKESEKRISVQ
jgi:hypothetical protein